MKFTIAIASIFAISQAGDCDIDEAQNALGPNQCWWDSECAGDRYCSAWGWCHGESNCYDTMPLDPVQILQLEVDDLEQDIVDLNIEVKEMRQAFRQITQIMTTEFNN